MRMLLLLCLTEDTRLLHSIYRILSIKYLVCRKNRRTAFDGKKYLTQFYNLDAIIAVGYRYTVPIVSNEMLFGTMCMIASANLIASLLFRNNEKIKSCLQ